MQLSIKQTVLDFKTKKTVVLLLSSSLIVSETPTKNKENIL